MHVHRKFSYSHAQNIPQPHRQSKKLRKMNVNIKSMVYWSSLVLQGCYLRNWELKSYEMCTNFQCMHHACTWEIIRIHTQSNSPIPCLLFTPLWIMNIDTRTKALVWFWCPESMGYTNETKNTKCVHVVSINTYEVHTLKYTQNAYAHPHTHRSHQCHAYCLHHSRLWL